MRSRRRGHALGIITAIAASICSLPPQNAAVAGEAAAPAATGTPELLTAKERLGEKWTDEQRVDNCNVPLDKRGSKPRPDACPNPSPLHPPLVGEGSDGGVRGTGG
jgi:hypothetical protein